jgi:murein L,D-transpeptidase YafK
MRFVSFLCFSSLVAVATDSVCGGRATSILVSTRQHALWLCEAEQVKKSYAVALGEGGTGKQRVGDRKTPLGIYSIGFPRPSSEYRIFIPIGYPTMEQKVEGYTGGQIGLHGPPQRKNQLTWLAAFVDWTQGCLAVSSNSQIEEIANWVKKATPTFIRVE